MIEIARRLAALKRTWQTLEVAPRSLALLGLPGKDSRFVEELIDGLAFMSSTLETAPQESLTMVRRSCEEQLKHLEAFFTIQSQEAPAIRMLGFITLLLQMESILKGATAQILDIHAPNRNIA
ncbi:MAG TPA: hypothetical protein VJ961_10060 [Mariprofundaceae bacterium]|nr:hypothetical protein [Mariprofundaceae bacterium]